MDATGTGSAMLVAMSMGGQTALLLAGEHSERVAGVVFLGPHVRLSDPPADEREAAIASFEQPLESYDGWAKVNANYWTADFKGFLEFFWSQAFVEPHSTKQIEDCIGWDLQTTPETLIATMRPRASWPMTREPWAGACAAQCS